MVYLFGALLPYDRRFGTHRMMHDMTIDPPTIYVEVRQRLQKEIAEALPHAKIRSRRDLMQAYGVSRTTIDRAISELIGQGYLYARNGSGTYVAGKNHPSPAVRQMRSWGVLLPDIRHYTYPGILRGIEQVSFKHDVNLIVGNIENQAARQTSYLRNFIDSKVSGVIIVPARPNPSEDLEGQLFTMLQELKDQDIPFVFCNRNALGIEAPQVVSNDFQGGLLATRHLLAQGYRRIAYISHPRYTISLNRYMGYLSALSLAGRQPDENLTAFSSSWDFEAPGYQELGRMLDGPEPPDAVFCFTDLIARGAYRAICERDLAPGRDVGLVGYDDSQVCRSLEIPLTSVKTHSFEMGQKAAQLLFDGLNGTSPGGNPSIILPPDLVVRESSTR